MGSKYYYFTDPQLIGAQFADQAFGPAPASGGYDRFHITDMHTPKTAGDSLPVYALCDAQVCAQVATDSAGATTLSLILKPKVPPPFEFPFLCYVIYKGVDATSLLTSISGEVDASKADNKLVAAIQKRADEAGESTLSREWLGLHFDQSFDDPLDDRSFLDTDPLDNLFYRCGAQHALVQVRGGDLIGAFDASQFGVELLVERLGQRPKIGLARRPDNYIKVATLAAGADATTSFLHWHDKEQVLAHADPCTFWSSFRQHKLRVLDSVLDKFTPRTGAAIYEDVLRGAHADSGPGAGAYHNRNRAYIDIRNEHGHSLDYYKADGTTVQVTLDSSADIDTCGVDYYRSGWPCFWLGTSDLPSGAIPDLAAVRFALPRTETTYPLIFVSAGEVEAKGKTKEAQRFIQRPRRADQPFQEEAAFFVPTRVDAGQSKLIASYQRLHQFKRPIVVDGVAKTPANANALISSCAPGREYFFAAPLLMDLPIGSQGLQIKFYDDLFFINAWTRHGQGYAARAGIGCDGVNVMLVMAPVAYDASSSASATRPGFAPLASFARAGFDAVGDILGKLGGDYVRGAVTDPSNANSPIYIIEGALPETAALVAPANQWASAFSPPFGAAVLTTPLLHVERVSDLVDMSESNSKGRLTLEYLETAPPVKKTVQPISLSVYADARLHG